MWVLNKTQLKLIEPVTQKSWCMAFLNNAYVKWGIMVLIMWKINIIKIYGVISLPQGTKIIKKGKGLFF